MNRIGGVRTLPQTGEVVMKWLSFVRIAIILLVILFVVVKRKKDDKEKNYKREFEFDKRKSKGFTFKFYNSFNMKSKSYKQGFR